VEAGRVFQLLQEAGLKTAHFNRVYRQKDPELKAVVLHLRQGQTDQALQRLNEQGRLHEYSNSRERYAEIAKAYVASPQGTLVVSPDNDSRRQLNTAIRDEMRKQGSLGQETYEVSILVGRDLTRADTKRASSYRIGAGPTCRRHDIDPQLYFTQLLVNLPGLPSSQWLDWLPD